MEGRSVTLAGFPRSISTVKLKLLIEKRITSPGTIESVQKRSENVLLTFKDEEGLQKFYNAAITDIEFGQIKYPIRVIKQEPQNDPSPPQQNLQTPTSGNEKPRASTPCAAEHRPQSLSPKSPKAGAQTQEKLIKSTYFWSSLSQLPAAEGIICVLAQNINPDTHIQKIRLHFESKRRSNGGPVACFVNMIDGLLVVFENAADCESCLEMSDQKLGDKDLAVFPKMIPKFHDKKFVIEGVGPNTTEDTLIMFLECCMKDEIPPKSCTKQKIAGVYLVEYGQDVSMDASEKAELLWRIESQKLEGNKLKPKLLLRTDCLKVSGIPLDVSNDQIRLVFESKKRTGGGSVTRIDRVENHSALVYLALFEDAERIFEKSKASGGSVIINQHPVAVQMYYHSLARDHENIIKDFQPTPAPNSDSPKDGETHQLQPFLFEPKCDENLLNFICGREKHLGILKTVFDRFAAIEVIKKEETILLKCTSRKPLSKMLQKDFEAKCEKQLENHFSKYSASSANFDKKKLEKARLLKLYPQIEEAYTSENNADLVVNWKPNEATVQLIGLKEAVDHMIEHITKCINTTPNNDEKQQLQPFLFEPTCDENLLNFVCGRSKKHLGILKNVFDRFSAIDVIKNEDTILLKFTARKPLSKMSQKDFEAKCEKQLEYHFSKYYSASSASFDKKKLEEARSLKLYPQIEEANTSEKNEDLVVRWQPNEATVQLIGLKEAVDHMKEHITKCINSTVYSKKLGAVSV